MTVAQVQDTTLPPRYLVEHFRKAYQGVHHREPMVRYMGNHWYYVNGETVHRTTLLEEITRLREYSQRTVIVKAEQNHNILQKLIAKLKSM